jgi:serine phosphatase RsbU (regulator of sigma subunit)
LEKVLEKNASLKAKKIIDSVFSEIEKFSLDSRKFDDQTIVVMKAEDAD